MPPTTNQDNERDGSIVLYGSPFDHERADLAIRSLDDKLFLVSRLSIEMASPTLLNRLASSDDSKKEEMGPELASKRPVLIIPYPSSIIAHLLSTIYPVPLELPNDFNHVVSLLSAAEELGMKYSSDVIRRSLSPKQLLQSDPINAYFIACQYGLPEEMRRAAEYSIGHPLRLQEMVFPGDLVYKLHAFHRAWTQQSRTVVDALTEKYGQTCLLAHEHTTETSSVRCTHKRVGWSDSLRASFTQALNNPRAINRTMLCLKLLSEPTRPTFFGAASSSDDKNLNFKKLDDICLDVETSAAQALASMEFTDLTDPYALMRSNEVAPESETKVHVKHDRVDADIILRSCDGVLFKTYKVILSMSSSFFRDMFSLPIVAEGNQSSNVVQMTEKSATLESLLSIILPIKTTVPATFSEFALVLAAAQKFDMEYAIETLRDGAATWLKPSSACSRYGIASRLRLRDEALAAAKELVISPATIEYYGEDIRYFDAHALQLLLVYRANCQRVGQFRLSTADLLHNLLWRALGEPSKINCLVPSTRGDRSVPVWIVMLFTFESGSYVGLERALSPWPQSHLEGAIAIHTRSTKCAYCMSLSPQTLYHALSEGFREVAVKSVVFPSWD